MVVDEMGSFYEELSFQHYLQHHSGTTRTAERQSCLQVRRQVCCDKMSSVAIKSYKYNRRSLCDQLATVTSSRLSLLKSKSNSCKRSNYDFTKENMRRGYNMVKCLEFSLLVHQVPGSNPSCGITSWNFHLETKLPEIDWQHVYVGKIHTTALSMVHLVMGK